MHSASNLSSRDWKQLDRRLRRVDEQRWLSSRYAPLPERQAFVALYLFNYELARIRTVVTETGLGAIRFQWWRDALEDIASDNGRRHDVAIALSEQVTSDRLSIPALHSLIDDHEAAFEAQDRAAEPEARLAAMAVQMLVPVHSWGEAIVAIAPHWAGLRRGENIGFGPIVATAPRQIRPAIAHFRLRRLMAKEDKSGRFAQRISVMLAMLTGNV